MVSLVFSLFCYGTGQPFIFLGGGGGGGGLAKEKQSHAQEKKEKKLVHKEAWETVYASLTYFWDLYNGNVRKEILIFLIVFEWKVLNSHNFDLPDIKNQLQKCWDTPTKTDPSCFKSISISYWILGSLRSTSYEMCKHGCSYRYFNQEIWSYHPCIDSTALVTCSLSDSF